MVTAKRDNLLFTIQLHLLSFSELSLPFSLLAALSLVPISHHESPSTGKMTQWYYILLNTNISSFCIIIHSPLPYSPARGWKAMLKLTTWSHTKCNKQNTHHFSGNLCRVPNSLSGFQYPHFVSAMLNRYKTYHTSCLFSLFKTAGKVVSRSWRRFLFKVGTHGAFDAIFLLWLINTPGKECAKGAVRLFPWLPSSLHRTKGRRPQKAPQSWSPTWLSAGNGEGDYSLRQILYLKGEGV